MTNPAHLALPLFLMLAACNQAEEPTAQESAATEASARKASDPATEPTMQPPAGTQAAGATASATTDAAGEDECGAAKAMVHLNSLPSSDVLAAMRAAIGHNRIRVINPGDMVTMDYRPDRLNIETGTDGRIKAIRCG